MKTSLACMLAAAIALLGALGQPGAPGCHAAAGDRIWERAGQPDTYGTAFGVASQDGVVVAAGMSSRGVQSPRENWFVRAHDEATGRVLWEDRRDVGAWDRSQFVAIDGGLAFASGWYSTGARGFDFVVRAYELHTGVLRWERRIHRGSTDLAEALFASGGRLFAVGSLMGTSGSSDFAVLALDETTGRTRWESVNDPTGIGVTDRAHAVVANADTVFVSGPTTGEGVLVRAYDAATGAIRWDDFLEEGDQFFGGRALAVESDTVYFAGGLFDDALGEFDATLRAYDARTGALRWSDRHDHDGNDSAFSVAVSGGRVVAVGSDGCNTSLVDCKFFERAYDSATGRFLWEDRFQLVSGGDAYAQDVVIQGDDVLATGAAMDATGVYQSIVHTDHLVDGAFSWERLEGPGSVNWMCVSPGRVFTAGWSGDPFAFVTRAYELAP